LRPAAGGISWLGPFFENGAHSGFELIYALLHVFEILTLGIGQEAVLKVVGDLTASLDNTTGNANDGGIIGDRMNHYATRSYLNVVAKSDVAKDLCSSADHNPVANRRVTLATLLACSAKGDSLIEDDIIPDDRCLSYNYSHAVVDEESTADGCAGVDFNSGNHSGDLRDYAREEPEADPVKEVSYAMQEDGVQAGVADQHFKGAGRRRVFPEDSVNLFLNGAPHIYFDAS